MLEISFPYNWRTHPEKLPTEIFVCNCHLEDFPKKQKYWKTGRLGCRAFNYYGEPMEGYFPVFAQIEENPKLAANYIAKYQEMEKRARDPHNLKYWRQPPLPRH